MASFGTGPQFQMGPAHIALIFHPKEIETLRTPSSVDGNFIQFHVFEKEPDKVQLILLKNGLEVVNQPIKRGN